ncbi:MAG: hypothetical protein WCT04_08190 [Planctomycetota bacterium]
MKRMSILALTLVLSVCVSVACAAERALADGLTAAGVATASKGGVAQAKDMFFKALAHDDTCPDALFELAKIVDKEGDSATAGDLFQRAALIYAQEGKAANATKRTEADKRAKALNPAAAKLAAAYEDYVLDLDKIVKKLPDPLTEASALERVNDLQLPSVLPPDKLPKFFAAAQAAREKKVAATTKKNSDDNQPPEGGGGKKRRMQENPKAEGATDPDVEKELKALGWATVTGVWIKKSPGVYEATDAKLEAPKTNGAIDFWVLKSGGDGTVKATVRTDANAPRKGGFFGGGGPGGDGPSESDVQGYGIYYRGKDFKTYTYADRGGKGGKGGFGGGQFGGGGVSHLGTFPISEANPKNRFTIHIDDTQIDYICNNVPTHSSNPKMSKTGGFVLDVNGTVTLEAPRCTGK